jgi:hypothetical protein
MQKDGGYASRKSFVDLMTAIPGKMLNYHSELWDSKSIDTEFSKVEEELISRALSDPVSPKLI